MGKKSYTVTLDEIVVQESQGYLQEGGAKLSPVLNNLLKAWNKEMKKFYSSEEEEE